MVSMPRAFVKATSYYLDGEYLAPRWPIISSRTRCLFGVLNDLGRLEVRLCLNVTAAALTLPLMTPEMIEHSLTQSL